MLNILEAVRKQNLKTRILSIGSSEEYGEYASQEMPLKETYKLNPLNPYAVAKVSQEMLCKVYTVLDVDVVMTRSFNHIGPRQSDRFVVPSFIKQLVTISQGKQEVMSVGNIEVARDFTDVRDVVAAYYAICTEVNAEKFTTFVPELRINYRKLSKRRKIFWALKRISELMKRVCARMMQCLSAAAVKNQ